MSYARDYREQLELRYGPLGASTIQLVDAAKEAWEAARSACRECDGKERAVAVKMLLDAAKLQEMAEENAKSCSERLGNGYEPLPPVATR